MFLVLPRLRLAHLLRLGSWRVEVSGPIPVPRICFLDAVWAKGKDRQILLGPTCFFHTTWYIMSPPFLGGEDSFYDSKIIVSAEHWELHPTLLGGFSVLPSIQTYLPRTSLGVFVTLKRIRTSYDDQSWPKGWWLNSRFYPYVCINLPTKDILGSMVFAVAVVFFVFVFQ